MKQMTVNIVVRYKVDVSLLDCIKSRIIGTQVLENHLKDAIDKIDNNDIEEVERLKREVDTLMKLNIQSVKRRK